MTNERQSEKPAYPAEKARQGEIILRKRWQLIVFIAGLSGCILLLLILRLWMMAS